MLCLLRKSLTWNTATVNSFLQLLIAVSPWIFLLVVFAIFCYYYSWFKSRFPRLFSWLADTKPSAVDVPKKIPRKSFWLFRLINNFRRNQGR